MTDAAPFAFRPAAPADEAAVRSCAQAAYARYVPAIGRRPAPMDADYDASIAAGHVRVATGPDGAVVGFVAFFEARGAMMLETVAVRPGAAGRGIGKALIALCEAEACRAGLPAVRLYTNARMVENLSIYPHLGYVETGRRHQDGFDRVFFEKRLDP